MRQTLLFGTLMLLAACGNPGDRPWDENADGLITACEGLNPMACDATPGCEREPVACILLCRDDGHGGCLPCPQVEVCRPVLPPPPRDCAQLSASLCSFAPQCELVTEQVCDGGAAPTPGSTDLAAPQPRCGNECFRVQRCQDRQLTACEQLSPDECLSKPGCAIVHDVAEAFAPCAPGSDCQRPEVDPLPRCITAPVPPACEQRDLGSCTIDGQCMLEQNGVCDVYCEPGQLCAPCTVGEVTCVPVRPVDQCALRDSASCDIDGRCMLESYGCPAVCEDDGAGGCLPCPAPPSACVPVATPPPSRCAGLDEQSCAAAGCTVVSSDIACAAVCDLLEDGGCRPCPDFACIDP